MNVWPLMYSEGPAPPAKRLAEIGPGADLPFGIRERSFEHRHHTPPILANCTPRDRISKCQLRNWLIESTWSS